jgi:hypothetical protein
MVRLIETMHPSCTDTDADTKRTKMRFHMTYVTEEFHRVRLKRFLSLWYVQGKPCTYLASRLALSQNGWNRAPLELRHLGVPSSASKMISQHMVHLAQSFPYLTLILTLYLNGPNEDSTWLTSPRCSTDCVQNNFQAYGIFGANLHRSRVQISTIS